MHSVSCVHIFAVRIPSARLDWIPIEFEASLQSISMAAASPSSLHSPPSSTKLLHRSCCKKSWRGGGDSLQANQSANGESGEENVLSTHDCEDTRILQSLTCNLKSKKP